ncbi:hypothetical protein LSCM1_02312 [Leishmania martiniquensis]|uniref:Ribosomal protein L3 n=1 Tax=Leishmania martiniquensis TaxID=1580590 RepID=A0A836GIJ3_9TRYP|nr:hypothetical protein LSCM1_02312 [Leishmania martiniquensis]
MSHCKFEHPRHGHLGFLPRKRSARSAAARAFPKDDATQKPHLTSFMVFKAGMTHIVRDVDRPGSKVNKKEVVEPVTILEAPPMVIVGIVGYRQTPVGLKTIGTVWAHHTSVEFRRRYYKNWKQSAQLAFTRQKQFANTKEGKVAEARTLNAFAKKASVIRVIAHTQLRKLRNHRVCKEGACAGDPNQRRQHCGEDRAGQVPAGEGGACGLRLPAVGGVRRVLRDEGPRYGGCGEALGRCLPAAQDAPRSAQGCVHRRLASCPRHVHGCARRSARLPPPHAAQQEDLPDRPHCCCGAEPGNHNV